MLRKGISYGLVLAALTIVFVRPAHASLELTSSMSATCNNLACDDITFALSVPDQGPYTDAKVDIIRVHALKAFFEFEAVQEIWNYVDGVKQTLNWNTYYEDDAETPGFEIAMNSGARALQPIYLRITFLTADADHVKDGSITYSAHGYASGQVFSTQGQVTPEPVTMLLMGTGLMGVAGAARRRRKNDEVV